MKEEISHWLILVGKPTMTGLTRKTARKRLKEMKEEGKLPGPNEYLYIGKCVNCKNGHTKIVLEI